MACVQMKMNAGQQEHEKHSCNDLLPAKFFIGNWNGINPHGGVFSH
jgi:hypothetical protein